jgi:arginine decarboxylase
VTRQRRGDTTAVMLDYVGYDLAELRQTYKAKVDAAGLEPAEAAKAGGAGGGPDRTTASAR